MGIVYPSSLQSTPILTQFVAGGIPLEDRLVVEHEEDLHNPNTWGEILYGFMWGLRIYTGMIVAVVGDTDDKNGLYWLKEMPRLESCYEIGEWPGTQQEPCLHIDGWEKVGGGSEVETDTQTILKNPTGKFTEDPNNPGHYIPDPNWTDPDPSDDNQIWVNKVQGGSWS